MRHEIWGTPLPAVTLTLGRGETVITQSGGMSWMTDNITMESNMKGGLAKGLGRMLSGESLFLASYTAQSDGQQITFASSFPGEIRPFAISNGRAIIAQKNAFLCAEPGVEIKAHVVKGLKGALFGGEGFVLQRYSGNGMIFCELDGSVQERELQPGETIIVDTSNVAAYEESVNYTARTVKGFKNILFGGEGLFLTELTGPGKVWLQTMTIGDLAGKMRPFFPETGSK